MLYISVQLQMDSNILEVPGTTEKEVKYSKPVIKLYKNPSFYEFHLSNCLESI